MQEIRRKKVSVLGLRTAAPKVLRVVALVLLVGGVAAVVISYMRMKDRPEFRLRSGPAQLSTEVKSVIENLERREMNEKGDRLKLYMKATRDIIFTDGHHELENVYLEVYPEQGDHPDKISAQRTVSNEDATVFWFNGAVQIETRDRLVVKSEAIGYDLKNESGEVTAPVVFERENVTGRADAATLNARAKLLELRGNVEITVKPQEGGGAGARQAGIPNVNLRGQPVTMKSQRASFDQQRMSVIFVGGAVAEQGQDVMSGDSLGALLNEQRHVKTIEARGNSYLRTSQPGRSAEVFAGDMNFHFDDAQKLQRANASTNVRARTLDADSEVELRTPGAADLDFVVQEGRSVLKEMRAGARPVVTMAAPKSKAGDPRAASKRLTADSVRLQWRAKGKDLERAEADGNSELVIDPAAPGPAAERKTLNAARFVCLFQEANNLARTCDATGGARARIDPLQPTPQRGTRTLTSSQMTARFAPQTQDVERIDAEGEARFQERERTLASQNMAAVFGAQQALERVDAAGDAKFNEQDRNGQSAQMSYTAADEVIRLRGGEPTVWDSRARLKAAEIDSDTRNKISHARGKVSTTYYSQEQTNGAAPFKNTKSPVFIASSAAEFQHETGIGVYTGAARAWQDDNFVKADRITLRRNERRMEAEGGVQSGLYQARRKEQGGARTVVPVFATSQRMFFNDPDRLLHYEGDVDIKQGTERITSAVADVYLLKDSYEVERTIAQRDVVVTQPGKRGTGDWAQYTAADETIVLTGSPARVADAERGTSESRRMMVYLREDRVVSDGGGGSGGEGPKQTTGRVRTTHKIRKQSGN
ncbi:MAG TPA: LPS export ABC transporter periplasmic protein LptC [Pyrinomonadaceae bacterium]|nr:LPS export ABC transporter periplasmic protein LptC [Pyrinomonadaceae bacterium]